MTITIYIIQKNKSDEFEEIINSYKKMISKFATLKIIYIFNKEISKAHSIGTKEAKEIYFKTYQPFMRKGLNIALDESGKMMNSNEFSNIISKNANINLYIGGSYGFNEKMLQNCDETVSLSRLTFAHKVTKVVLVEQLYRALSIFNNHPYHKD